jgi:hypothetical protein
MQASTLVVATALVFVGTAAVAVTTADQPDSDSSRIQIGFDYATQQGITLNVAHRNRALVGLGSYLVNAIGGCNDCHTSPDGFAPGGSPYRFLGASKQVNVQCYLAGGQSFGPFVSRDITPWQNGMPAGLTLDEFIHVIRTGEDPDHPGQVLFVMPWPTYQTMSDRDLTAIYEYLSAIPAIPANTCGDRSE